MHHVALDDDDDNGDDYEKLKTKQWHKPGPKAVQQGHNHLTKYQLK